MKKNDLLKMVDNALLEKLYGFCYARTNDSYEAEELCSDIIFELVKAAHAEGDIDSPLSYLWKVARNTYADFADSRKRRSHIFYEGDPDEILLSAAAREWESQDEELLNTVYRQISFLSKAYREIMILFYLDGLSTAEIAALQGTSETAIRQRLFLAREKIRNEVNEMDEMKSKPVSLDKIEYAMWGDGSPAWGDPRNVCTRQLSKHIVWLCRKKPMSASEITAKLNVPTLYVEDELEILTAGENGKYGLLRKQKNGKYAINFILLDRETMEKANGIYIEQLPAICSKVSDFIEKNKEAYLSFPYMNRKLDLNLILWQQIVFISRIFRQCVNKILVKKYFPEVDKIDRPFTVYGYVDNGIRHGAGWDSVDAENICGYTTIYLENIYFSRIREHFHCNLNVATDTQIQIMLRAIHGLEYELLTEKEKEHAAKAIECGYLYREGSMLYTKILVSAMKDRKHLFDLSSQLNDGCFDSAAEIAASKIADLIRRTVPEHLLPEWGCFNSLAAIPVFDCLVDTLIEQKILTPPKDGIGAEGCWVSVE